MYIEILSISYLSISPGRLPAGLINSDDIYVDINQYQLGVGNELGVRIHIIKLTNRWLGGLVVAAAPRLPWPSECHLSTPHQDESLISDYYHIWTYVLYIDQRV